MASDNNTIVGVFNDYSKAEQAGRELVEHGFPRDSVHVQSSNKTAAAGRSEYQTDENGGGIRGFFHRIFGGDDAGGAENESSRYSQAVEGGRSVVLVNAPDQQIDHAVALLNQYGAVDIDDDPSDYTGSPYTDASRAAAAGTAAVNTSTARTAAGSGRSIPVVDEELKIGKRAVQRGGVRIYSQVVSRPVEEKVTLRDEHVRVERRPADRPISDAELSSLRDQSFELTETVEEPVIEKRARVTEEVVLGKETTEKTQTVRDTVRHTDVKVEKFGPGNTGTVGTTDNYEADFRNDWQRNYSGQGGDYSAYAPAYSYGYRYASDPRYTGRSWNEVEPELRSSFERENPGGTWERMKNAVRYAWDKVTGR
jgi:uncharacterized protein (TIGR02271 family)